MWSRLLVVVLLFETTLGSLHSLDGSWLVRNATIQVQGNVPGTVPDALFRAGVEGDPSYGFNQRRVLDYSTRDNFTYSRSFVTPPPCSASSCELIFDGIDTAAVITVNGNVVGNARNMHMRYVFDVTQELNPVGANNTLEVHITSAVIYALEYADTHGDPGCKKRNRGLHWPTKNGHGTICSTYIRKNTGMEFTLS
jgi:beta-mannosidase